MPATKIHDAVTVVLLHEDHIFMLRRQQALKAFPGYWAFPGGKVDQSDQTDTEHLGPWGSAFDNNLMHALARELHEELGLSLNQLFDDGDVIDLKKIGQALTPPIIPVRFNTHFFRLRLKRRPNVQLALSESAECDWAPAEDWLRQFRDGQMLLAPPTLGSLRLFESGADTASGNAQMEDVDRDGVPLIES
ncbi:MAG: NUDIX domain-containing protein, partial [Panacagrimonas sp.]